MINRPSIRAGPRAPGSLTRSRWCISTEPLHPAPAPGPGAPGCKLGQKSPRAMCCPWFLVGESREKTPMAPQAGGIHQLGMRSGSSLGQRGVISIPAMAGPALSSGQVWEQPQGPTAREGAAGTLLPPYATAEPLPHCWPCRAAPRPHAHPKEGTIMLSARSDVLGASPALHCLAVGTGAGFSTGCARAGSELSSGSARLLPLAMLLGLYSHHVPSAAPMSPGTPMAEPARQRMAVSVVGQ